MVFVGIVFISILFVLRVSQFVLALKVNNFKIIDIVICFSLEK